MDNEVRYVYLGILNGIKYHLKYIGQFSIDNVGPYVEINNDYGMCARSVPSGCYVSRFEDPTISYEKVSNDLVSITPKKWYGYNHPFEITHHGNVEKVYIAGQRVILNKSSNTTFVNLRFDVNLGYWRKSVVVYDKLGNKSTTFIDGEAVRAD